MIKGFDRFNRRFLDFTAVHPCEGISPATLIQSLITLSHNICIYRSIYFPIHKKNSRETLRQVEILLMFFEEIESQKTHLSNSIVPSFSELHVALQKILFLFEDVTRGARLYVLMKSHFITTQFRVLIRSIATVLDVIALSEIDISFEVKELVDLVAKQARKVKIETDPEDETVMGRVNLILNKFENKVEPDKGFIKSVLDYLRINTWKECHNEIKFIDDEISIECLDGTNREVSLMSSLLGFMCYCRVVIFEEGDYGNFDQTNGRPSFEIVTCLNYEDFRCPISLEFMTDPVTVSTGQTYERASIQKWFKSGNLICPVTGEKLANTELVPNTSLHKLILQFCADNGISLAKSRKKNRNITRTILPSSPSLAESIKFLSDFIWNRLYFGTEENKNKAAYEIRLLAKSNIYNRECLIDAGTIPPLLYLLSSNNSSIQENAIAGLLKLSKHESGKKAIVEDEGLEPIISVLKKGINLESRQIAAATIFYLASVNEYREKIGESQEAITALAKLIKDGTNFGKKNATVAIFGLILHKPNHQRVLSSGIVPILIEILSSSNEEELVSDSLAVLATLAEGSEGSTAISTTNSLPVFIRVLKSSNSHAAKEHCVSILLAMCNNCGANVVDYLAKESCLMGLLYSVSTEGTSHARRKAREVIKLILRNQRTSSSSSSRNLAFSQELYVNVR